MSERSDHTSIQDQTSGRKSAGNDDIRRRLRAMFVTVIQNGWVQLALGEVVCIGGAMAVHYVETGRWLNVPLTNTIVAAAIVFFFCQLIYRRLARFPGEFAFGQIAPLFLGVAFMAAGLFVATRLPYSLSFAGTAAILATIWFLALTHILRSVRPDSIGLLDFGETGNTSWIPKHFRTRTITSTGDSADDCDFVIADLHADLPAAWQTYIAETTLRGVPILHVRNVRETLTGRVAIRHLSENPVGALLPSTGYMLAKRLADIMLVIATLPITIPLIAAGWLLVKRDGPGAAFYRQTRIGYRGRPFRITKLRTMTNGAGTGAAVTSANDQRITAVGRFLRLYHIDELPQIWNILRGDMSWIGPRPDVPERREEYADAIPFFSYRHVVRPGITGWAQVHQGYAETVDEIAEKLEYDFYYIKNLSLWLDTLILVKTMRIIIRAAGAR